MVLVLEITSSRLFAYIGRSHATATALSVALLGLGLGAFARLRGGDRLRRPELALAGALLALEVAIVVGVPLPGLVAIALGPFAVAGMLVSRAYAMRGSASARSTYAIDLMAAAAGCVVAPRLIGPLSPTEIIAIAGVLVCILAWIVAGHRSLGVGLLALAEVGMLIASFTGGLPDGPLEALLRTDRPSEKAIVDSSTSPADVVDSAWSPIGRLDVHRTPGDPSRLGVFTDGMSPTYMVDHAHAREAPFEASWGLLMSLPYRAFHPERVLLLGSGAGASVWLAKKYGATRVDAVEVNPEIPSVMARWRSFAGDVYHQPGVQLVIDDARRFLVDRDDRYDVIELALALTGNVHTQPAGLEAHLYTVEAVQLYLRHLSPAGSLVLIHSDPGNAYRQLATVLDALEGMGIPRTRALDGIAVLRDPRPGTAYRYLLVVRASAMAPALVEALDVEPAELLWGPGDPPERGAELLDPRKLGATGRDDLSPVHDDRPYFFQNTKGLIATALAEPGRLWVLAGALVLVIVVTLSHLRSLRFTDDEARPFLRPAVVATGLGAAYLCVELALIQRFTLAAGGTLYAVSFVLFGLLAWSALGAIVLAGRLRRLDRGVTIGCAAAGIVVVVMALGLRDLAWLDDISSSAGRSLVILVLLAPVGLTLGGPFPVLLSHHGEPASRIASLWAINGAASVAGGVIAVLALRVGGTTEALVVAGCLYLAIAAVAPRRGALTTAA